MGRVSAPLDPRDPFSGGSGSEEISAAADRARKQLREDFEQLRTEIGEHPAEEAGGGGQPPRPGLRNKARATVAALALTAAVATAATNFALNGGRSPKDGGVSAPQPSPEGEAGGITASVGGAETRGPQSRAELPFPLSGPGLRLGALTSSGGNSGTVPPFGTLPSNGPKTVFVVGQPLPVGGNGPRGGATTPAAPPAPAPTPTPTPTDIPPPATVEAPNAEDNGKGLVPALVGGNPGADGDHPAKAPHPHKPPK